MGLEGLLSKDKVGDAGDIANPIPTEGAMVNGAEPLGLVLGQVSGRRATITPRLATPHPMPRRASPHITSRHITSRHIALGHITSQSPHTTSPRRHVATSPRLTPPHVT